MPTWFALALIAAAQAAAQPREQGWNWRETLSPHFAVEHEMPWTPPGFVMSLERIHGRLRMDLGMFSSWMSKERLKLYLYKDSGSYLSGQFQPPSWSNGLALYELKAVAVPDNPDRKALLQVIGHELTHVLFEGYWHEAGQAPPSWLNEGLAMMEEAEDPEHPERSAWFQNMVLAKPDSFLPLPRFFTLSPTKDLDNKTVIADWYIQAFSMVYFLYREHQRLQFKNLCVQLRDGRSLDQSLWLAYRYHGLDSLEKDWRRWLGRSELREKVRKALAETSGQTSGDGKAKDPFTGTKFVPMKGFKSLRE